MQDESKEDRSRFVVGIDLGTTNSALAYVDSEAADGQPRIFAVPQLVAPSVVEDRDCLPSFHYQPAADEISMQARRLPWEESRGGAIVGVLAREQGAVAPARLIASAKSWLSHGGVDRTAPILPWQGAEDVKRCSPLEVSASYLRHLRLAWNHAWPGDPLEEQDLVLTVPASFDEVARELTIEAARQAGLGRIVLIEEPQAAFYAWLRQEGRGASQGLNPGERILVCDVGGGTTDLSLIRVDEGGNGQGESPGSARFHRLAVGEHLILGGDNLDLALARHLESKLGFDLSPRQWSVLVGRCRQAKEVFLGPEPPEAQTLNLPGGGSRLIGGSLGVELTRQEAEDLLLEGFLPRVGLDARPAEHASGFRELGLPYAPDPAITKYLAEFLRRNRAQGVGNRPAVRPDVVLVNGGFFAGRALLRRFLEVLASWFQDAEEWAPRLLEPQRLDLAVALGAAHYGMVRRGKGERLHAGLARAYYVGTEDGAGEARALCLAPAGLDEGESVEIAEEEFELRIRQPVEFPIFSSSSRTMDQPGDSVEVDPTRLSALPPIRTVLRSGKKQEAGRVRVSLGARLSEIGLLELWCKEVSGDRRWRLDFDVRAAVQSELEGHGGEGELRGFAEAALGEKARRLIEETFGPGGKGGPETLVSRLEEATEAQRWEWPPSLLRTFWEALMSLAEGRRRSLRHESRWLNLLGYCLRPGRGFAVDDWRVAETWRLFHAGVSFRRHEGCRAEWWVLWRRIAAGLSAGQQRVLSQGSLPRLASFLGSDQAKGRKKSKGGPRPGKHEAAEVWRLLGALEWLDVQVKEELGAMALADIEKQGVRHLSAAPLWCLARLGARVPAYGPLNSLVSPRLAQSWLTRLLALDSFDKDLPFAVLQLARRSGDRFRDLPEETRLGAVAWLGDHRAPDRYRELVLEPGDFEEGERQWVLGDSLPKGLRMT